MSERGRKHLLALAALAEQGQRAVLLFCIAHAGIRDVAPAAHLDPAYAATLEAVAARGVEVLAYGCEFGWHDSRPVSVALGGQLPVSLTRQVNVALGID